MARRDDPHRCPECGATQSEPIQNGLCIACHDRAYLEALARGDDVSRSIVDEYRLTARAVLDRLLP